MFHHLLSILLVGATLLGPSICCCTVKVAIAESSAPSGCCCQQDDPVDQCPADSDGKREHECPCRSRQSVAARLDDSLILETSPSVNWSIKLSDICSLLFFRSADDMSVQGASLLSGRCPTMQAGRAFLIAHGVSRC